MIAVVVIVAVLGILLAIGRKSVHTEIEIHASPQSVWQILTDVPKVKEWNPVLIPTEGILSEGNTIKYEFYQEENGKAAVIDAKVKQLVTNKLIKQRGGIPLVLTFDHQYIIEVAANGCKVTIHEAYRGIMVPFWNANPVEEAYTRLLKALKNKVEN